MWPLSCVFFFSDIISPRPPSLMLWHYFGFSCFRRHILAPPPLAGDMARVFVDVFYVPYGQASFLSLFSSPLASLFRGVGVGFEEPRYLRVVF